MAAIQRPRHKMPRYSCRSAAMGSMRNARRAGSKAAIIESVPNATVAAPKAI